jgi:RNA polymerase sigma-70 factor (ECF subfamily)
VIDSTDLINEARAGGHQAFERLVRPLIGQAHRLAYGILRDHHAAEDAVQEATFKAWRRFSQFRDGRDMRPWFLVIVANECRSVLRGRWWRTARFADLPERGTAPAAEAVATRTLEIGAALARLRYQHRLVLCLYYYLDLSQEEIGQMLGLSPSAVKARLHRAVGTVRRYMQVSSEEVRG